MTKERAYNWTVKKKRKSIRLTITRKMYGWSKYGGARHGMLKEALDEWYCQLCAEKQTKVLPSYMLSDKDKREFIRICSKCKSKVIKKNIKSLTEAINSMRRHYFEDSWT